MNWPMCSALIDDENVLSSLQHRVGVLEPGDLVEGPRVGPHHVAGGRDHRALRAPDLAPGLVRLGGEPVEPRTSLVLGLSSHT